MAGDDDKTVFGGALPGQPDPNRKKPGTGDRTVIGGALPPRAAPGQGGGDRTVIGGALPTGQPPRGQPGQGFGQTAQPPSHQPPSDNTWLGGAVPHQPQVHTPSTPQNQGFFPEVQRPAAPQPQGRATPRISLDQALAAKGLGAGGPSNPLLAAAANLLILFGRLRTGMVDLQVEPLMNHVVREIQDYEQNAIGRGADPHQARVGTYALCGTADDIVQNLPGANPGDWLQYSMVARFFQKRDSGVGFFQEAEKAMQAPAANYDLLELMLVCMSLGFEGQYRTMPNGSVELARIRAAIYETLRRVKARPNEDIAVNWQAVPMNARRRFGGFPMWIVAAIAAVLVVGGYAGLSTIINREGAALATQLHRMHPNVANISLVRTAAPAETFQPFVAERDTTQLDRMRESLADQIANGSVEVGEKGNFIFIRVGNTLLFNSGSATVRPEFSELAGHIADTLNAEQGPILVQGFTDDIQPSGRGRYKTNLDLSIARADGVKTVLEGLVAAPARLSVEGKGEADPIADNATPEGRALNRRVEILLAREGTFDSSRGLEDEAVVTEEGASE